MKDIFPRKGFNFMRSKGRAVLHSEVLPHFASHFNNGDKIVEVGKHNFWDYKPYFVNAGLICDYITIDTKAGIVDAVTQQPLEYMVENLLNSRIEPSSLDGLLFIGMHDNISDPPKAYEEIYRLLKPGGRVLVAFPGSGAKCGGELVEPDQWRQFLTKFIVDTVWYVYGPEDQERYGEDKNTSILVTARKPR